MEYQTRKHNYTIIPGDNPKGIITLEIIPGEIELELDLLNYAEQVAKNIGNALKKVDAVEFIGYKDGNIGLGLELSEKLTINERARLYEICNDVEDLTGIGVGVKAKSIPPLANSIGLYIQSEAEHVVVYRRKNL
jgi:hypothetical protein